MTFTLRAANARESILGHNNILWRHGEVLSEDSAEVVLGIEEDGLDPSSSEQPTVPAERNAGNGSSALPPLVPQTSNHFATQPDVQMSPRAEVHQALAFQELPELDSLDFFRPFHDPEMLDLFPFGQPLNFPFFETSPMGLDVCDMWAAAPSNTAEVYMG